MEIVKNGVNDRPRVEFFKNLKESRSAHLSISCREISKLKT